MTVQLLIYFGLVIASLAAPAADADGQIWAVLVAGSNGYDNYRHQADICHAYQIFRRHRVPDTNIIVMMYDDIASNEDNPKPGKIYNKPNGSNVYKNVPKDYTGSDVTPENFLKVITGDKGAVAGVGSGKVLQSGPNDHVFINFVDHGSTGFVGFPDGYLYADDLNDALKTMHKKKMYKRLVFYMEACESGSMFYEILPKNLNIYAVTAANPWESSWACYYDETVNAYLGDEFSVGWMEDIDYDEKMKNLTSESLLMQYQNVVQRVTKSHPRMYGKLAIDKDKVIDYVGINNKSAPLGSLDITLKGRFTDSVSSRDVALLTLENKIKKTTDKEKRKTLLQKKESLIAGRRSVDKLFSNVLSRTVEGEQKKIVDSRAPMNLEIMKCYKPVVNYFTKNCIDINKNTYALVHMYKFANLCAHGESHNDIIKVLSHVCNENHKTMIGIN